VGEQWPGRVLAGTEQRGDLGEGRGRVGDARADQQVVVDRGVDGERRHNVVAGQPDQDHPAAATGQAQRPLDRPGRTRRLDDQVETGVGGVHHEARGAERRGQLSLGRALPADDQFGGRVQAEQVHGDQGQRAVADDRHPLPRPGTAAADRPPGHGGGLGQRRLEQIGRTPEHVHHLGREQHLIGGGPGPGGRRPTAPAPGWRSSRPPPRFRPRGSRSGRRR